MENESQRRNKDGSIGFLAWIKKRCLAEENGTQYKENVNKSKPTAACLSTKNTFSFLVLILYWGNLLWFTTVRFKSYTNARRKREKERRERDKSEIIPAVKITWAVKITNVFLSISVAHLKVVRGYAAEVRSRGARILHHLLLSHSHFFLHVESNRLSKSNACSSNFHAQSKTYLFPPKMAFGWHATDHGKTRANMITTVDGRTGLS